MLMRDQNKCFTLLTLTAYVGHGHLQKFTSSRSYPGWRNPPNPLLPVGVCRLHQVTVTVFIWAFSYVHVCTTSVTYQYSSHGNLGMGKVNVVSNVLATWWQPIMCAACFHVSETLLKYCYSPSLYCHARYIASRVIDGSSRIDSFQSIPTSQRPSIWNRNNQTTRKTKLSRLPLKKEEAEREGWWWKCPICHLLLINSDLPCSVCMEACPKLKSHLQSSRIEGKCCFSVFSSCMLHPRSKSRAYVLWLREIYCFIRNLTLF